MAFNPDEYLSASESGFDPNSYLDQTPGALEQARIKAEQAGLPPQFAQAQAKANLLQREAMREVPSGTMPQASSPEAQAVLEGVGMLGGGLIGSAGGPAGTVAGAGLGVAGARKLADVAKYAGGLAGDNPVAAQDARTSAIQTLGDIAEGATAEAGGALIGKGVAAAGQAIAPAIRRAAEKSVAQALVYGGAPKAIKAQAEKVIPGILERPMGETYSLTRGGMKEKVAAARELAGEAINAEGKLVGDTDPGKVISALEKEKAKYIVEGQVVNPDAIKRVEKVQSIFAQYGDNISDEGLRGIRRVFDKEIARGKGFLTDLDERSLLDIKKTASDEIRGILADKHPDIAKLNKQYSFWANLDDVLGDTVQRTKPHRGFMGAMSAMAGAASAIAGGGGIQRAAIMAALFKATEAAMTSPGWKLASARAKDSIAKSLVNIDPMGLANAVKGVKGIGAAVFPALVRIATLNALPSGPERYMRVGDKIVKTSGPAPSPYPPFTPPFGVPQTPPQSPPVDL